MSQKMISPLKLLFLFAAFALFEPQGFCQGEPSPAGEGYAEALGAAINPWSYQEGFDQEDRVDFTEFKWFSKWLESGDDIVKSNFFGHVVVLYLPKTGPQAKEKILAMSDLQDKYRERGLVVVALTTPNSLERNFGLSRVNHLCAVSNTEMKKYALKQLIYTSAEYLVIDSLGFTAYLARTGGAEEVIQSLLEGAMPIQYQLETKGLGKSLAKLKFTRAIKIASKDADTLESLKKVLQFQIDLAKQSLAEGDIFNARARAKALAVIMKGTDFQALADGISSEIKNSKEHSSLVEAQESLDEILQDLEDETSKSKVKGNGYISQKLWQKLNEGAMAIVKKYSDNEFIKMKNETLQLRLDRYSPIKECSVCQKHRYQCKC